MTNAKTYEACSKQVLKLAAPRLLILGFRRTKPTFFTREREHCCEFVHVHRFSGQPQYRLHAGIRLFTSAFPACALNGPHTGTAPERFRLSFADDSESWDRCAREFEKFVAVIAEPWFAQVANLDVLLSQGSPLTPDEQRALKEAVAGRASADNIRVSRRLLGL
jgi:hypothetical protein